MSSQVVQYPSSVLTEPTNYVEHFRTRELTRLVRVMKRVMRARKGIGLAANQIGCGTRVAIISDQVTEGGLVLINPEITHCSSPRESKEGCLSVAEGTESYWVSRYGNIDVTYRDTEGTEFKLQCSGLLAIVIQHEVDHLNGLLINGG